MLCDDREHRIVAFCSIEAELYTQRGMTEETAAALQALAAETATLATRAQAFDQRRRSGGAAPGGLMTSHARTPRLPSANAVLPAQGRLYDLSRIQDASLRRRPTV